MQKLIFILISLTLLAACSEDQKAPESRYAEREKARERKKNDEKIDRIDAQLNVLLEQKLQVREGRELHLVLLGKAQSDYHVVSKSIILNSESDTVQVLDRELILTSTRPSACIHEEDFNFDGFPDLAVLDDSPDSGPQEWAIFLYDDANGKFVISESLSAYPLPEILPGKKLRVKYSPNDEMSVEIRFGLENGQIVTEKSVYTRYNSDGSGTRITRERKNGQLQVVETENFDGTGDFK